MLSSQPHARSRGFELVAVATLLAFTSACVEWKVVPLKEIEVGPDVKPSTVIRVHREGVETPTTIEVRSLDFPNVTGIDMDVQPTPREVTIDLRRTTSIEVGNPRIYGSWKVVPLEQGAIPPEVKPTAVIRVRQQGDAAPVTMEVRSLNYPSVTGTDLESTTSLVTVDLRQATSVEVKSISGWRTGLAVVGALVLVVVIAALAKTSCPFVYVDGGDGMQFVGEAYSGATSRSIQRDDLMPLPPLGAHPRVVLANEASEAQFTDLLEVVTVDRAPAGERSRRTTRG